MTHIDTIRLIAAREIRERTRSRIFRLGTGLTVLIVLASVVLPVIVQSGKSTPVFGVGFVQPFSDVLENSVVDLGPQLGLQVIPSDFGSFDEGEAALREHNIAVLVGESGEVVTLTAPDPNVNNPTNRLASSVRSIVGLYAALGRTGLTPEAASSALSAEPPPVRGLLPAPHRNSKDASSSTSGMILLFVFLTLYGAFILNGVIEEKTSRVVEILLSCASPRDLLIGKVLGIGAVGSIQGLVLVAATLVARAATPGAPSSSLTVPVIGYTLLWFLLGFGVFGWLYACAGALVSRSEDAQNLVFPLQLPLVASYLVGLYSVVSGPNIWVRVLSLIPFTAPMTMLERMAAEEVAWWEVAISVVACLITSYFVMRLAVTIFSGGILRSGQRVKFREAWRNPG